MIVPMCKSAQNQAPQSDQILAFAPTRGHDRRKVGCGDSLLKTALRLILCQPTHWDHVRKILNADEAPPPAATAWWSWNKGLDSGAASITSTGLSALQSISEKWNVCDLPAYLFYMRPHFTY